MLDAFELLARLRVRLVARHAASFDGLVHPYHRRGRVVAWEITSLAAGVVSSESR
jgi:hypothetical protein